jgi:hypothetical protein
MKGSGTWGVRNAVQMSSINDVRSAGEGKGKEPGSCGN